ncbi:Ig-like domain-containing protein [Microbacterium sp. NPDC055910]|uniref:Ig-like domain-containing protein n=1 Tax=Microbacterium sp. NPDC055910 TaxID=3345659 RepID=UPI0035D71069
MRRRTTAGLVAAAAAVALVTTASIVWPGLDAKETPRIDASVWALQTADGRGYARVNTTVGELDTVRSISNPDLVVQAPDAAYLLSDSLSTITRIDEAQPADLDDETLDVSTPTPTGTVDVAAADDFIAYLTDAGAVFAGRLSLGDAAQLAPFADGDDSPRYTADAIAVDERGILFAYSRADGSVLRYDIASSTVRGRDAVAVDATEALAITAAGDTWAVVDTDTGTLWRRGADAAEQAPTTGPVVVGEPDAHGDAMYLADEISVVTVPADDGPAARAYGIGDTVLGVPAAPVVHDGDVYAAWLGQGGTGGLLWNSRDDAAVPLDYGDAVLSDQRRPTFVEGRDALLLNETRSGWVWTVPDGELVPSSQDWSLDDRVEAESVVSDEELPVMLDPKPPVAEPDSFGVRAGALAALPVLMNDHDPNEDVLSIVGESVTGLDPGFGTVSLTDDAQRLTVRVAPGATGSATFSYAVTDGTSDDGLVSEPATVTITVAPESANTAPQWCGVERCLLEWPEPEVARGGTVTVPVLHGWVDPEGDPVLLLSVDNPSGIGSVAATPGGEVVYQHDDDGSGGEQLVELALTFADARGATTVEPLIVRVTPQPALDVRSFAVVDVLAPGTTVDVTAHVTGTTGMLSLSSVRVLDDAPATATIVGGTTEFDFSARAAGTYRVDFTVTDGAQEGSGTARITILPEDAPPQLATAPVVAFVHPQKDATIDVLEAVHNPTRRVLLLSDVEATPEAGASLSVDAVGQRHLRVSGATASGASGRLGTVRYVVSDGTEDAGARVEGEATVYLLPPAPELAPIAVDDRVVVRAGTQIDIPVLENDVAPAGGRPVLDPSRVVSSTDDALAFASGDLLRYLAPTEPGEYTIDYAVFTTGSPALADVATVRVQVLGDETNRAPLPERLEGRVLSGQSTVIDFTPFEMDPDGDTVTLDSIVTQPERGSASLSADGTSIVYTSVAGDRGQVSFTYRVVDPSGESGDARVRIGVLDAQSNPSPVTYTDYVQVQAGEGKSIRVRPLANDIDPVGGRLALTDARPDLPQTLVEGEPNPEFDRLAARLLSVDEQTVVVEAGQEPGTMSFLYDVASTSGNTARGLIVVSVVRESVPDYPVVSDTVLTAESREEFPTGVDVLSGKVAWSAGTVEDLDLSLWGDPDDVSVAGPRIRGPLTARTQLIPFAVSGEGAAGEVTTYAFLRVPGDGDVTLALRAGIAAPQVVELESVTFDMADLVARPRGSRLEVGGEATASGARADSACVVEAGTRVRYDAGAGAPWTDACRVAVRLEGQDEWTQLSVPITVCARDPQPELKAGSVTVGPGETTTFDLRSMTTWQLRDDWAGIAYALDYTGTSFTASLDGSIVTVTGADRAVPGLDEAAVVSVTSHADVTPARLILRVGAAPSTLPRGGSVTQQCSQASGSSCTFTVIGAAGEVNPLPRTPLEVAAIRDAGSCSGVTFARVSAATVSATWTADTAGMTCTAAFSVQDAQGRRTNGERDGRIVFDLLGYPKGPASIAQTGYADGSVTLRIDPGAARAAYPELTGFVVVSDGREVARCPADGACPEISAPNGEPRTYEAFARNAVGQSVASVRTVAWAYDAPAAPASVTVRPVPAGAEGGIVALTVEGLDRDTGSVEITSATGDTVRVPVGRGSSTLDVRSYRLGTNARSPITVTPYSRFELPPGLGGSPTGASTIGWGNGVGAPLASDLVLESTSNGDGTSTVTARASAQLNGTGSSLRYGIVRDGQTCRVTTDGSSATFSGLADGEEYRFVLCVESFWGDEAFARAETSKTVRAAQSGRAPRGYTFVVDATPDVVPSAGRAQWVIRDTPRSSEPVPNRNRVQFDAWSPGSGTFGQDPGIRVRYVHEFWGIATDWSAVAPAPGSAPYQLQASWQLASPCVGGGALTPTGTSSNGPGGTVAAFQFDASRVVYYDAAGAVVPHEAGTWAVPVGAIRVDGIGVTASWSQWGLSPASATFGASCNPNLPPDPEEAP